MAQPNAVPASVKEVERRVDELFASKHILEIQDIANKTKAEAEDKKLELKKLIGHRYRDIIDASDSILEMRNAVSKLSQQLTEMGRLCHALDPSRRGAEVAGLPRPEDELFDLYKHRLARQVDFLIRAPTDIELFLVKKDFISAAKHYVVSEVVYKHLQAWTPADERLQKLKQSFAIIDNQWNKIQKYLERIGSDCRKCLSETDETEIERDSFANALVGLAILESRSPMQLFVEFIDRRKKAFTSILNTLREQAQGSVSSSPAAQRVSTVQDVLVQLVSLVQSSLYQLGCIFIRDHIELLDVTVAPAPTKSPSLTPVKNTSNSVVSSSSMRYEAQLISMRSQAITSMSSMIQATLNINDPTQLQKCMPSSASTTFLLSFDSVRNLATDWLKSLPKFLPSIEDILKMIPSGLDLMRLRSGVVEKITNAFTHLDLTTRSGSTSSISPSPSANSLSLSSQASILPSAASSWKQVASVVLSEDIELWSLLFHKPFTQRSIALIQSSFSSAISLEPKIDATLKDLVESLRKNDPRTEERHMGEYIWEDSEGSVDHNRLLGLSRRTKTLITEFDKQMQQSLQDILYIADEQPRVDETTFFVPPTMKADSKEFRIHMQQACVDAIAAFALKLRQRIEAIRTSINTTTSSSQSADAGAASKRTQAFLQVEQALLLARFARGIHQTSHMLKEIIFKLDPTEAIVSKNPTFTSAFLTPTKPGRPGALRSAPNTPGTPSSKQSSNPLFNTHSPKALNLFARATRELDSAYIDGYLAWVENTAQYLESVLADKLAANLGIAPSVVGTSSDSLVTDLPTLVTARVRATWQELKGGSSGAEEHVPHQPSPFIVSFLFNVVQEIQRVGSHCVDNEIVECLVSQLSTRAVSVFDNFVNGHKDAAASSIIPKEVTIQLWFDAKFFFDILSCRTISSALVRSRLAAMTTGSSSEVLIVDENMPDDYDEVEEMLSWKRIIDAHIARVKSLIDPIDLAFYTPHVTKNLRSCYQRMYILFGTLTQASSLPGENTPASTAPLSQQPAVSMSMVGTSTRFTLLPISAASTAAIPMTVGKASNPASPAENGKPPSASGARGKAGDGKEKAGIWDKFSSIRGSLFS